MNFIFWFKYHLYKLIDHNMIKVVHSLHGMFSHRIFRNLALIRKQTHGFMGPGFVHPSECLWDVGLVLSGIQSSGAVSATGTLTNVSHKLGGPYHQQRGSTGSRLIPFIATSVGQATYPECIPLDSPVSFWLETSPLARGYAEAQKRSFKGQLKISLTEANIDCEIRETVAAKRPSWHRGDVRWGFLVQPPT